MLNRLTHQALQLACRRSSNAFRAQSHHLEFIQRQKLEFLGLLRHLPAKGRPKA